LHYFYHWSLGSHTRDCIILQAIEDGKDVIVDDTNIHPKHVEHIRNLVYGKADVEIKSFMLITASECIRRDSLRKGNEHVGKKVILGMLSQYKEFNKGYIPELHGQLSPKYEEWVPGKKKLLICDIDGTISLITDRSPYDVASCMKDVLNKHVKDILDVYALQDDVLIYFVTGRKEDFKEVTEQWLNKFAVPYDKLIMRKSDDNRPDSVVKKEIYENDFKDKYNILFILEDRDRVVSMYRKDLNLPVFQVKEGNY